MLIDVHAHLDDEKITDVKEIISSSEKAGINAIINCGVHVKSNRDTLELSKKYNIIKPAFGFYPLFVKKEKRADVLKEIEWIKSKKPIAISEIGLDGTDGPDLECQKEYCSMFLKLASELNIPAIIHSRKAENSVLDIIKESGYKKVVLHCFCGKKALVRTAAEMDLYFSIPVTIIKSGQFQDLVREIKLTRLLTETDSPYLGPETGKLNEPKNVKLTIKKIAEIKGITKEECEKAIFMNYQRIFL